MKQKSQHPSGRKLRGLFCVGLAAVLAAGIALNTAAANSQPVQYDVKVVSSSTHTAALSEHKLYFWGTNEAGQLPGFEEDYSPEPVQLLSGVRDVAVSAAATLVVDSAGGLTLYGADPISGYPLQDGKETIARDAAQVASGKDFHAYISKSGALYTWGRNDQGQLGTGDTENAETPVKILDGNVQKVALGNNFGLALLEDGTVYGWGCDSSLQIGYEENGAPVEMVLSPVQVAENVKDVAVGSSHSCLLMNDGSLWTCGDNSFSQTGSDDLSNSYNGLTRILTGIRSISAGDQHNFAVSNDNSVYSWGYGLSGQLGTGDTQRISTPTVSSLDYVQVFACSDNTFGISSDGSIYSFGGNTNYRLGKDNGSDSLSPMRILDADMNWVYTEIQEGHHHGTEGGSNASGTESSGVEEEPVQPEIVVTPFVNGYPDGTFKPNDDVTRAQFLKMLVSALCEDFDPDQSYGTCSFSDISVGRWEEQYIAYAEGKELVKGYADGTFHPGEPITRDEAAILTARFLGLDTENASDAGYTDLISGSGANASINTLSQMGVLSGYEDHTFKPKNNISRKEAAKLIAVAAGFSPTEEETASLLENAPAVSFSDVDSNSWYYIYLLRAVGYVDMPQEGTAE